MQEDNKHTVRCLTLLEVRTLQIKSVMNIFYIALKDIEG